MGTHPSLRGYRQEGSRACRAHDENRVTENAKRALP
nr:MAG TPA: hypothetical protein [Caudoviricetes sp.]